MNRIPALLTSLALISLFPLVSYAQSETAPYKVLGEHRCVNFRKEPSIKSSLIQCLQPGTVVQIVRMPPTGKFAWVKDRAGNLWYMAFIQGTRGWIQPECTNVFNGADANQCNDYKPIAGQVASSQKKEPASNHSINTRSRQATSADSAATGRRCIDIDIGEILESIGKKLPCYCPPEMFTNQIDGKYYLFGSAVITGTDAYDHRSRICDAAIHAGVRPDITKNTSVVIRIIPKKIPYVGTTRNGVTSESWEQGGWGKGASFMFVNAPTAADSPTTSIEQPSKELLAAREIARKLNEEYPGWKFTLPECPCTEAEIKNSPQFESGNYELEEHHPGAERGYRSSNPSIYINSKGQKLEPGQQCTYRGGLLITGGEGAGTPDAYSPNSNLSGFSRSHLRLDVEPSKAMTWQEYHRTWTPNKGVNCKPNEV